jgi:hypothetical protein
MAIGTRTVNQFTFGDCRLLAPSCPSGMSAVTVSIEVERTSRGHRENGEIDPFADMPRIAANLPVGEPKQCRRPIQAEVARSATGRCHR